MSSDATHPEKGTGDAPLAADLTRFQLRALAAVGAADGAPHGLAVTERLAADYDGAVYHSRVYPNLDTLAERGLLAKTARDARTNEYRLTDRGRAVLRRETDWLVTQARAAGLEGSA